MGITVRESMGIGGLQKATLLAGRAGLDKTIEYVSFAETPEVGHWLKGNEMMISSFYSMKNRLDLQLQVLEDMYNAGSAALVIPYPEIRGGVDSMVIAKADEYGLPLLSIPQDVYYLDIIMPVSRAINQQRLEQLEFINNLNAVFSNIVLDNKDLDFFANNLYQLIGKPVAFLSADLQPVAEAGCETLPELLMGREEIFKVLRSNNMLRCDVSYGDTVTAAFLFPVRVGNWVESALCILSSENQLPEQTRLAGEQAAIIYGWYILRDKSVRDALNRDSKDFVDTILYRQNLDEEQLLSTVEKIGLHPRSGYCMILIDPHAQEGKSDEYYKNLNHRCLNAINKYFLFDSPGSLVVPYANNYLIIYSVQSRHDYHKIYRALSGTAEQFILCMAGVHVKPAVGIGRVYTNFVDLRLSYREAETVINLAGRKLGTGGNDALFIDDIEEYAFLYDTRNTIPQYLKLTMKLLQDLEKYDRENGTELFETLKVMFLAGQNTDKAAKLLFVHRNTILYRKEKLKKLLTVDPFADENRFRFELALKYLIIIE